MQSTEDGSGGGQVGSGSAEGAAGRPWLTGMGLLALTGFLLASALSFWPYTVDDAFISLRYAQNLVEHGELAWNLGERVEGISNPLWTLYAATGLGLGLDPVIWLKIGGLLAGLATVPLTHRLASVVGGSGRVAMAAAALVATNASVALWSIAGLETLSFTLLLVLAVLRFEGELSARARGEGRRPLSAMLFALAWMSRPEAPAYALYVVARRVGALRGTPFGRADGVWLAIALGPIVAYELFGLLYFGGLLPATHSAKVGGGSPFLAAIAEGKMDKFLGTRFLFGQGYLFAAAWGIGIVGALATLRRIPAAAWAMALGGLVFIAYAFTDWMPRYRFFVPPLPFLAMAAALGLERVSLFLTGKRPSAAAALMAALVLGSAWDQGTRGYDRSHNVAVAVEPRGAWPLELADRAGAPWNPGRQELDAWYVLRETPGSEVIVCPDIGFIGSFARNPIWDIRGLVTPTAAAFLPTEPGTPEYEAAKMAMLDEVFALRPALILLPTRPQGMAPVARRFMKALRADPRTAAAYNESSETMPFRTLWMRRDLVAPDRAKRTAEGLAQFPSYGTEMRDDFAAKVGL